MLLVLLGGASAASNLTPTSPPSSPPRSPPPLPPSPPSSPAPAPPCTVEMLKQRPAGDKSWPVACSQTTLGTHEHRAWAALLTGNSENMTTLALVQVASLRRFSAYKTQ